MSRVKNTSKNFIFSVISTLLSSVLGFVSRTVFIRVIGITYLGANSLFTNIISMLSLTELGIGSAISFNLYKPLANNDIQAIKSLMSLYKRAYRYIAAIISVLGLSLVPFLNYLIKDSGNMEHTTFIYLVFLYNTVISYLFSYKITLLSADQKSYLMTNVNMIISVGTVGIQLLVLVIFKNYFVYLIVGAVIGTVQWFFINQYIYSRYPYLKDKDAQPLNADEKRTISTNVKAMMFHKLGELCINQTDNIIISSFISIVAVGLYNNYYMIINIINKFALSFFNAATASLGNLIATESYERRYEVFKKYNFLGFWIFGWTGICLYVLLNPFIEIWLGSKFLIDSLTLSLVMINYYLVGMRVTIGNVKMAAGLYKQDQWAPLVQAIINLVVSIIGAIYLGLPGVFLGTVVSSISIPCWYRPIIVYKYAFHKSAKEYFMTYFKYICIVAFNLLVVIGINYFALAQINLSIYLSFLLQCIVCAIVPNVIIIFLFHNTEEFRYLMKLANKFIRRY
ncbi:lipopolysaccharide biosynthesis protein [Alloiococcus sp. CFN-8]|uniref:lipopolysaccharide biosynthesis protein n=1 Tax=Alloiococcus sp. CFN-8 TaxID=3416081 RepID=UPI003CE9ADCA